MSITLIGSILLGWGLGANDAANVFGAAVSSRMIRWGAAAILTAAFVALGAWFQGEAGIETISALTNGDAAAATTAVFAAALTVVAMTLLKLPVSTSQAVVGSMIGVGMFNGDLNLDGMVKVVVCWLGTPLGAMLAYAILHYSTRLALHFTRPSIFALDSLQRTGLIIAGCYGAYALGANNVANVATPLVQSGAMNAKSAVLVGAASIAAGVLSLSKPVMLTIGRGITRLDGMSALLVVAASGATVHFYAFVGVPVSTSQAAVGAVLGIGLVRGLQVIHWRTLGKIAIGWIGTPVVAVLFVALIRLLA